MNINMNKVIIWSIGVFVLIIIAVLTMYCIDMNRMKNNQRVIFSTWGYSYTEPENWQIKEIVDETKTIEGLQFAEALEKIYEDEEYRYYFTCIMSQYITVKYENGYEKNVIEALNLKHISISDLKDNNINVLAEKKVFENQGTNEIHYFVGTVLEETTTYMIVAPNEDEIEINSSDKIKINYGVDHMDYLYGIGRKVVIGYNGLIMETYPAQINTNVIELSYKNFELFVKPAENQVKSLSTAFNNENNGRSVKYYCLEEVNVTIHEIEKTMTLKEALESGKIEPSELMARANKDNKLGLNATEITNEGESVIWEYEGYSLIKDDNILYITRSGATLDEINNVMRNH